MTTGKSEKRGARTRGGTGKTRKGEEGEKGAKARKRGKATRTANARKRTNARKGGKTRKGATPLDRLRLLCADLPGFHEVEAWEAPTFRVKNKLFAMYADTGNEHTEGRASIWIKAAPHNQEMMIRSAPEKFFKPPYVGPSGWVGVYVDRNVDWDEVAALLEDGYRMTAPKRLLAELNADQ